MNQEELKKCPICDSVVELIERGNSYTKSRQAEIYCKVCNLRIIVGAIRHTLDWCVDKIVQLWNSAYCWKEIDRLKAALQAKDAEIAELKESLDGTTLRVNRLMMENFRIESILKSEREWSDKFVDVVTKLNIEHADGCENSNHDVVCELVTEADILIATHRKPEETQK